MIDKFSVPAHPPKPVWGIEAKKKLLEKNMTVRDLAEELGICRTTVSAVINGKQIRPDVQIAILNYLGLSA